MHQTYSKNYTDLCKLNSFEDRFNYLKINGRVGEETFGHDRYLNQVLYRSKEWRSFRSKIIYRDQGCDLGIKDGNHDINGMIIVHHINPITVEDALNKDPKIFDPENVITVWDITHKAIHYGDIGLLPTPLNERKPNDTCPWRN